MITAAIAHEPPIVLALPDGQHVLRFFEHIFEVARRHGHAVAQRLFEAVHFGHIFQDPEHSMPDLCPEEGGQDMEYFFAWEMLPFVRYLVDYDRLIAGGVPLAIASGEQSALYHYFYPGRAIAERVGVDFVTFPGHHLSAFTDPSPSLRPSTTRSANSAVTARHTQARPTEVHVDREEPVADMSSPSPERSDRMGNIEHDTETGLAEFVAGWRKGQEAIPWLTVTLAVAGLTNLGEKPVLSTRLAEVVGQPVSEAEALARQWGPPGTRVEDGHISYDPERARSAARRHVQVGDRRFGITGCGPDIFEYAPLARPSLLLEETCTVTGTLIRILFTPSGVERVEPSGAVLAMPHPQELTRAAVAADIEDVDANQCVQTPLFSSPEAAGGWLAAHPGGHVFPIKEAWDLSIFRDWRDKMSALLNLDD